MVDSIGAPPAPFLTLKSPFFRGKLKKIEKTRKIAAWQEV